MVPYQPTENEVVTCAKEIVDTSLAHMVTFIRQSVDSEKRAFAILRQIRPNDTPAMLADRFDLYETACKLEGAESQAMLAKLLAEET